MTAVPHSGNLCSGLCMTPCAHTDCWQCQGVHTERRFASAGAVLQEAKNRLAAMEISPLLRSKGSRADQRTTITRSILEGLCERAGIVMEWNDGAPIFRDGAKEGERTVLVAKVKELEKIVADQKAGTVTEKVARSLAKAAGEQMDTMVSDVIRQSANRTLVADAVEHEAAAIQKLKDGGASDDDIEAAKTLLGWKPKEADIVIDPERVQQMVNARLISKTTGHQMLGISYDEMSNEMSTIAGLNDLLNGMAPARVLNSSSAIKESITQTLTRLAKEMKAAGVPQDATGVIVHPDYWKSLKFPSE